MNDIIIKLAFFPPTRDKLIETLSIDFIEVSRYHYSSKNDSFSVITPYNMNTYLRNMKEFGGGVTVFIGLKSNYWLLEKSIPFKLYDAKLQALRISVEDDLKAQLNDLELPEGESINDIINDIVRKYLVYDYRSDKNRKKNRRNIRLVVMDDHNIAHVILYIETVENIENPSEDKVIKTIFGGLL